MSLVAQRMPASGCAAWPIVRNFGNPQRYTHFVRTSALVAGDEASIGKAWEDTFVSGLPTFTSSERLEILDDGRHILSFSIVDVSWKLIHLGELRLGSENYEVVCPKKDLV
ncbi:hypothetical protein ZWY2020_033254 [Hordeum vulgare]|nr:hypothetical protein ZWY2020_033254 [Hordeum vulgare]